MATPESCVHSQRCYRIAVCAVVLVLVVCDQCHETAQACCYRTFASAAVSREAHRDIQNLDSRAVVYNLEILELEEHWQVSRIMAA